MILLQKAVYLLPHIWSRNSYHIRKVHLIYRKTRIFIPQSCWHMNVPQHYLLLETTMDKMCSLTERCQRVPKHWDTQQQCRSVQSVVLKPKPSYLTRSEQCFCGVAGQSRLQRKESRWHGLLQPALLGCCGIQMHIQPFLSSPEQENAHCLPSPMTHL